MTRVCIEERGAEWGREIALGGQRAKRTSVKRRNGPGIREG